MRKTSDYTFSLPSSELTSFLPLQISVLVLIPQLYSIDDILPYDVSAWCDDTYGVEEVEHQPDTHDIILLAERLAPVDASLVAPDAAHCLADGEKDDAHYERSRSMRASTVPERGEWSIVCIDRPMMMLRLKDQR